LENVVTRGDAKNAVVLLSGSVQETDEVLEDFRIDVLGAVIEFVRNAASPQQPRIEHDIEGLTDS